MKQGILRLVPVVLVELSEALLVAGVGPIHEPQAHDDLGAVLDEAGLQLVVVLVVFGQRGVKTKSNRAGKSRRIRTQMRFGLHVTDNDLRGCACRCIVVSLSAAIT